MRLRKKNILVNPDDYASPQPKAGPPVTAAAARSTMQGYDYVIVGAGTAGCVLANKLSEDPAVTVLVLEAGGDNKSVLATKVPLLFPKLFHGKHDWDYYTEAQPHLANRKLYWPRGRIIGGSSSLNAMIYHHCAKSDFDEWAALHGCQGWSYDDLAPYLKEMEHFTHKADRPHIDEENRGTGGKLRTGYSWLTRVGDKGFIPSCNGAGIPTNADVNTAESSLGVTQCQSFIDNKGRRSSMATAYLSKEVLKRKNLFVASHVRVTRVLFDQLDDEKGDPTVIGVEIQKSRHGQIFQVHAKREVILCAGTINTPQTLMLSAIGPSQELAQQGIPILKDNSNVGKNLKDHLCSTGVLCKAKPGVTLDYLASPMKAIPELVRWAIFGSGPLTSNVGEVAAFIRSFEHQFEGTSSTSIPEDNTSGEKAPDVEIIGAPITYIHHGEESAPEGADAFSLAPICLRPKSSGYITLRSSDVFDSPVINPRYLSDESNNDQKVLVAGLRICLKIMKASHLQQFLAGVPPDDDPASPWWPYSSTDVEAITDEQLACFMKEKAFTLYHPLAQLEWVLHHRPALLTCSVEFMEFVV